jgi:ArsR family transcriptional regulator, arsenate/arsenite/antimonite-responsive transcriptional repressor
MAKYDVELDHVAHIGLAVSDANRLRLIMALAGRSLCVCQLTELLNLAPSTVSKHLSILKQAGLVKEDKRGRWVYHELCPADCPCAPVVHWVQARLERDEVVAADRVKLKQIMAINPEELCRR